MEIVGLSYSTVKWLAALAQEGRFPHAGVKVANDVHYPYSVWADRLKSSFERHFYIPKVCKCLQLLAVVVVVVVAAVRLLCSHTSSLRRMKRAISSFVETLYTEQASTRTLWALLHRGATTNCGQTLLSP